jgi:hypothetical protein
LLLLARPARAKVGFPAADGIYFSPDPKVVVARTTFALLPSTDDGATWSYLCYGSLGLPIQPYEEPALAFASNGALVAGLDSPNVGLDVSNDLGCDWRCAGGRLAGQQIIDVVARPGLAVRLVALAGTYGAIVDAGLFAQVFETADDGATWSALGSPIGPSVIAVTSLGVSASDPMRIYVAATRGYRSAKTASLFVSTDGAQTWTERPISQFLGDSVPGDGGTGGEQSILIGAVDPGDEDRVYLRSRASVSGGLARLYVTTDGGQSFLVAATFPVPFVAPALIGEAPSFALSPDGSKIYVGTKERGLWIATRAQVIFHQVNAGVSVQCLASRQTPGGPELWACANEYTNPPGNSDNFIVGRSVDDGVTFEAKMPTLTSLKGLAACPSGEGGTFACQASASTGTACMCQEYTSYCQTTEYPFACQGCGMPGLDAGSEAGGAPLVDGGAQEARRGPQSSCGSSCAAVATQDQALGGFLAGGAVAAALLARRRRK